MVNRTTAVYLGSLVFFLLGLLVLYIYPYEVSPTDLDKKALNAQISSKSHYLDLVPPSTPVNNFDNLGRLIYSSSKKEVPCPRQDNRVGVFVAIGQSNSANSSPSKIPPKFSEKIFNYFDGKCFLASSPLLGATGDGGEFLTPLADALLNAGIYREVVIFSSGIGGTSIVRWQKDGDLNGMLLNSLSPFLERYQPTQVIWHQGESDFLGNTSTKAYISSFLSLKNSLSEIGISAPFFISISTQCNQRDWSIENPTSNAQKQLIKYKNIFLGANTDLLLYDFDRAPDKCHFSQSGILKTANSYAMAIIKNINNR